MSKATKKTNFGQQVAELERIVAQLEAGDLSVDESLELFEAGLKLAKELQTALKKTQTTIETLQATYELD